MTETAVKLDKGLLDSVANQVDYCDRHLGGATVARVAAQLDLSAADVRAAIKRLGDRVESFKDEDRGESYLRLAQ